jgi:hypothetical protein
MSRPELTLPPKLIPGTEQEHTKKKVKLNTRATPKDYYEKGRQKSND